MRFDAGSRALYATDALELPQAADRRRHPAHASTTSSPTIDVCRDHGAPIVSRGGGTSLAGQGCNIAVLIDFSKYLHHILEIDPGRRVARVQPGCSSTTCANAAEEQHGLTFGPDPSTHAHCTLGGMIGNNSCGVALGDVASSTGRAALTPTTSSSSRC